GETRAIWGVGYLAGALYAPLAVEAVGWELAVAGAAVLTLVAGIGPAVVAASWRRTVAIEVGDVRIRLRDARLVLLLVIGAAQLAVSAGIQGVAGGLRIAELFPAGAGVLGVVIPATFIAGAFRAPRRARSRVARSPRSGLASRSASASRWWS